MFYEFRKFGALTMRATWSTWVGKPHVRMRKCSMTPWGEVPPDLTALFPDFVLQVGIALKWLHVKFGVKAPKPGGARVENVFCGLFCCFSEMASFHVHIFVAFYSIRVKGCTVVVSSMVYNCVNGKGHCIKVTQVIAVWKGHLRQGICSPGFEIARCSCVLLRNDHIPNVRSKRSNWGYLRSNMSFLLFAHAQCRIHCV